jgi:hypothetical protein
VKHRRAVLKPSQFGLGESFENTSSKRGRSAFRTQMMQWREDGFQPDQQARTLNDFLNLRSASDESEEDGW